MNLLSFLVFLPMIMSPSPVATAVTVGDAPLEVVQQPGDGLYPKGVGYVYQIKWAADHGVIAFFADFSDEGYRFMPLKSPDEVTVQMDSGNTWRYRIQYVEGYFWLRHFQEQADPHTGDGDFFERFFVDPEPGYNRVVFHIVQCFEVTPCGDFFVVGKRVE